jgi:hypothetical protein
MTLTLTQLLEIDAKLLAPEEERGLILARLLWKEAGYPSERRALCRALERILTVSQDEGIRYPAILLRRKKELERGTWAPRPAPAAAAARDTPGDPNCTICLGVGSIANPGGLSGRLCECYLRKHGAKPSPEAPEPAAW